MRYLGKEVVLVRAMPRLLCWKRKQNCCYRTQGTCLCFDSWTGIQLSISDTHSYILHREHKEGSVQLLLPPHTPYGSAGLWKHLVLYPAVCIAPRPVTTAFICLQSTEFKTNSAVALVLLGSLGIALRHLMLAIGYSKENKVWIKSFLFRSLSIQ